MLNGEGWSLAALATEFGGAEAVFQWNRRKRVGARGRLGWRAALPADPAAADRLHNVRGRGPLKFRLYDTSEEVFVPGRRSGPQQRDIDRDHSHVPIPSAGSPADTPVT